MQSGTELGLTSGREEKKDSILNILSSCEVQLPAASYAYNAKATSAQNRGYWTCPLLKVVNATVHMLFSFDQPVIWSDSTPFSPIRLILSFKDTRKDDCPKSSSGFVPSSSLSHPTIIKDRERRWRDRGERGERQTQRDRERDWSLILEDKDLRQKPSLTTCTC